MELSLHFVTNLILFVVCGAMGTMFLAIPTPKKEGLKNYRISLKVVASSYFLLALLTLAVLIFKLPDNARELFTFTSISISAFQAFLFTNALITLLNPKFVTAKYLLVQLIPFVILITLFIVFNNIFGDPVVTQFNELAMYLNNPTLLLLLLFYALYVVQLVVYTSLYFIQEKKYRNRAKDFFSDDVWLKLTWVRWAFLSALVVGIISMVSYFFAQKYDWIFNLLYATFYFGFALEYIKYNKIFKLIEPEIALDEPEVSLVATKTRVRANWTTLKMQIIVNSYYLEPGINIEEMARRLNIGRTTLSTFINRDEGMNFNTWVNTLRIEKAKELLLDSPDEPLSSISEKVGYSEQANFSRQFRQITGYAPTLWRQKQEAC
ncbi:MAG: AraC family transcriptional regulator [Salinivirgaceae bacterium]